MLELSLTSNVPAGDNLQLPKLRAGRQAPHSKSSQIAQAVETLEQGSPLERVLASGDSHAYQITLAEGTFLKVVVEQSGLNIALSLRGPDGKQITEVNSEIGNLREVAVAHVAEVAGSYRIIVKAAQRQAPANRYVIRVAELREATDRDRKLMEAARLSAESARLYGLGKYPEARLLIERELEIRTKELGPEHPLVAGSLSNLGILYRAMGDYAKAEQMHQRALTIREKVLGSEHLYVAQSLNNLAVLYFSKGDYAKAELLYKQALAIREKALDPEHPDVLLSLGNIVNLYRRTGDYERAEPLYHRVLSITEKTMGPEHPKITEPLINLGAIYRVKGDYTKAELYQLRALAIREKTLGAEHPGVASALQNLAALYAEKGDNVQAISFQSRALEIYERKIADNLGPGSERQKLAYLATLSNGENRTISLHLNYAPNDKTASNLAAAAILQRRESRDGLGRCEYNRQSY